MKNAIDAAIPPSPPPAPLKKKPSKPTTSPSGKEGHIQRKSTNQQRYNASTPTHRHHLPIAHHHQIPLPLPLFLSPKIPQSSNTMKPPPKANTPALNPPSPLTAPPQQLHPHRAYSSKKPRNQSSSHSIPRPHTNQTMHTISAQLSKQNFCREMRDICVLCYSLYSELRE